MAQWPIPAWVNTHKPLASAKQRCHQRHLVANMPSTEPFRRAQPSFAWVIPDVFVNLGHACCHTRSAPFSYWTKTDESTALTLPNWKVFSIKHSDHLETVCCCEAVD